MRGRELGGYESGDFGELCRCGCGLDVCGLLAHWKE